MEFIIRSPDPRPPLVYVGGSMRNREGVLAVSKAIRAAGFDAFDQWLAPGEETDEKWQEYAGASGEDYLTALSSPHARNVLEFDCKWLSRADAFVLVYPAGKSAHIELGLMIGCGRPSFVLLDKEPERFDVMLGMATRVTYQIEDIVEELNGRLG